VSLYYGKLCFDNQNRLDRARLLFFKKCLAHFSERLQLGISPKTIACKIRYLEMYNRFLKSSPEINFANIGFCSQSLIAYRRHLISESRAGKHKINTIAAYFRDVRNILLSISDTYERESILRIPAINKANNQIESISPPPEENIHRYLDLSRRVFFGISDHILNFENYPIKIEFEKRMYWGVPTLQVSWISAETENRYNRPFNNAYSP